MTALNGLHWAIVAGFAVAAFMVMEAEKSLRNYLAYLKHDTDDKEFDELFDLKPPKQVIKLPDEADRFGRDLVTR